MQTKGATKYYQPKFVRGKAPSDTKLKTEVAKYGKMIAEFLESRDNAIQEPVSATPDATPATEQSFQDLRKQFTPAPPLTEKVESDNDTDSLPF